MNDNNLRGVALGLTLVLGLGCGATSAASGPGGASAAPTWQHKVLTNNDHAATFDRMDRMAMQIVRGTARTPEPEYQSKVRPAVRTKLLRLGVPESQAHQILAWVDEARADRARVRRWWVSRFGSPARDAEATQAAHTRSTGK